MAGGLTLGVDWEALGGGASAAVDGAHAVLVTGKDPIAAARVAIGIGRVQSRARRVAIGDLVGETDPLQRLVTGDDPHGIVDSFLYGVSLNKIARQVDEAGMLFVMPSGTEPVITADIMGNERWHRLAAGFREVGALLVLVAQSDAEGVHELAAMMDGVIVAGDATSVLSVPRNSVLAHVEAPAAPEAAPPVVAVPAPVIAAPSAPAAEEPPRARTSPVAPAAEKGTRGAAAAPAASGIPKAVMIAATVAVVAIGAWFAFGRKSAPEPTVDRPDVSESLAVDDTSNAEPVAAPSGNDADSVSTLRIENPQDSARAVAYGVVLVATNDEGAALARWADLGNKVPAGTVSMARIRGESGRFFQMQAGAYARPRQADSLLAALRANGRLNAGAGSVKSMPLALMLEAGVGRRAAPNVANGYAQRQIAAYPLLQPDGTAMIFVGAFENAEQAVPLRNELRAKGVSSTLHYRTGRSF
ncbi:MAG TPA: hypothetical protein VE861_13495 [Gemmatimonadaceae bacterium]|nr:hypothetical protein [Gemmatimonadaceae bacterium]